MGLNSPSARAVRQGLDEVLRRRMFEQRAARALRVRRRLGQALPDGDKRDVGVAFSLVAFFWRSKSKATRRRAETGIQFNIRAADSIHQPWQVNAIIQSTSHCQFVGRSPLRGRWFKCRFRPADGNLSFASPKGKVPKKRRPTSARNPVANHSCRARPELVAR